MPTAFRGVAIAAAGCFALGLASWRLHESRTTQLFGKLITSIATPDSVVALTFDDGPVSFFTDSVLAILAHEDVSATFFVVGSSAGRQPDLLRRIVTAGHELGNHSFSHDRMVLMSQPRIRFEIEATDSVIRRTGTTGAIPFRPPYGKRLVGLPWYLARSGRPTVLWTLEPDSRHRKREDMVAYVVRNVGPGAIILLHVEISSRVEERAALPLLIRSLKQRGYGFVTVSELIARERNAW